VRASTKRPHSAEHFVCVPISVPDGGLPRQELARRAGWHVGAQPSWASRFVGFVSLRGFVLQQPSLQDAAAALGDDLPAERVEVVEEGLFDAEVFGHGQESGIGCQKECSASPVDPIPFK
jgi:hypothetical protein